MHRAAPLPRIGLALAGAACLCLTLLLGHAVGPRGSGPDQELRQTLRAPLDGRPYQRAVRLLASERGWPHASYALALLPLAGAAGLLAWETGRQRRRPDLGGWRWLALLPLAVPLQQLLRDGFARAGPRAAAVAAGVRGAYPSGAALLVALGWAVGLVVVGDLRPRWRPAALAAAAVALALHSFGRIAASKHWPTDILGAYLLAAGVLLTAAATRRASPR